MSTNTTNCAIDIDEVTNANDEQFSSALLPQNLKFPPELGDPMTIFTNFLSELTPIPRKHEQTPEQKNLQEQQCEQILRVADFVFPPSLVEASLAVLDDPSSSIRYVRAVPSNRKLVLVREYFCFMPDTSIGRSNCKGFYYCSCRSFYQRIKRSKKNVCKHILAVLMAPYLGLGSDQDEEINEEEYVKLKLQKTGDELLT